MPLVTFDNVAKSFGSRRLFSGVSFALDVRDHAVLVGRNGAGKTTLLRLIAGAERPDEGRIARARGRRVWLHEQTPELNRDMPVRDYLMEAFGEATRLESKLRAAEQAMRALNEDSPELKTALSAYQDLHHRFDALGGYGYKGQLTTVLTGLGLPAEFLDRRLLSLSGGELTRTALARGLLADADLLLLDEPTNHLDIDSVEWLEQYLLDYRRAFVLVTHDRRLLERVGSRVLALEHEQVATIGADFATYVKEREAAGDLQTRIYGQTQEKIVQLQRYYDRFHAKKNKAKQAKAKLTQIERLKESLVPPTRAARRLRLGLPQPQPSARVVLEMKAPAIAVGSAAGHLEGSDAPGRGGKNASARRGEAPVVTGSPAGDAATGGGDDARRLLIRHVELVIERGEKLVLLGPNGSGKTTLVETIAGLHPLADGVAHLGHNVRLAYFSQQGRELDEEATLLQTVLPLAGHDEQLARRLLGRFLFPGDEVSKLVGQLSGGERSRLRLLTLLTGEANFLLLDEPTNHLDVESVEALAAALGEYTGTLLLVTHDRHLIDAVASRVLEIRDSTLAGHVSVDRYWEARAERAPHDEPARAERAPAAAAKAAAAQKARTAKAAEDERRRRARVRALEAEILRIEKQLGDLDAQLAEPETYTDRAFAAQLAGQRGKTEARLDELYEEWSRVLEAPAGGPET